MPDSNGVVHPTFGTCFHCKQGFEIAADGLIPRHSITVPAKKGASLDRVECRGSDKAYAEYADLCAEQRYLAAEIRRAEARRRPAES
jgi:hypothetical protein